MTYIALYIVVIASIWWISRVGLAEASKTILSILVPSVLIILCNIKAGRLLFKNPVVGVFSLLPIAVFIFKTSQPLVFTINAWIDRNTNDLVDSQDVVEAEVISKEDD